MLSANTCFLVCGAIFVFLWRHFVMYNFFKSVTKLDSHKKYGWIRCSADTKNCGLTVISMRGSNNFAYACLTPDIEFKKDSSQKCLPSGETLLKSSKKCASINRNQLGQLKEISVAFLKKSTKKEFLSSSIVMCDDIKWRSSNMLWNVTMLFEWKGNSLTWKEISTVK